MIDGKLTINLSKESYYSLGLNGVKSRVSSDRYVVTIDLCNPKFRPGNSFYDRVKWCFTNSVIANFSVLVTSTELDQQGRFVSSLELEDISFKRHSPQIVKSEVKNVFSPDFAELKSGVNELLVHDAVEWIGLVLTQSPRISIFDDVDPFISSYILPDSVNHRSDTVSVISLKSGIYIPQYVHFIQELLGKQDGASVLFASGFRHCPLVFGKENIGKGKSAYVEFYPSDLRVEFQ